MTKDPVCGMTIDATKAAATVKYEGKTYSFCSEGCKAKFQQNPARYAEGTATGHHE